MLLSNKFKIVFLATAFNLLFEYAFRGPMGLFIWRRFFVSLFLLYFAYYWIAEGLIRKYRLTNRQLMVVAAVFGILPMAFLTGSLFGQPLVLGVNLSRLFLIEIVWWGVLQGLLTFYFATRIVKRDWTGSPMTSLGWAVSAGFIIFLNLRSFLSSRTLPRGPLIGYIIVAAIVILGLRYLRRRLKASQQAPYECRKSPFLDFLAFGTVAVFLFLGTFVARNIAPVEGQVVNAAAGRLATIWSFVVFAGVVLYRLKTKKAISI